MKLTLEQIKSITIGAVDVWEEAGYVHFSRFYPAQLEMYKRENLDFYKKAQATAGIRLSFRTDSKKLSMKIRTEPGSSRNFFSVDVFADSKAIGAITQLPDRYLGAFSGEFALGEGEKTVTVYFPWSVALKLKELLLDDGAKIAPVHSEKMLLMYGDSITQGYDAKQSCNRYAVKLAAFLNAQEHNRAIGGEIYHPELAQLEGPVKPDYITIAYGTNDWTKITQDEFTKRCGDFVETVSRKNPQAQIFVLTPIWRKNYLEEKPFGPFENVGKCIRACCEGLSNVQVVDGWDFVPKDSAYYLDEVLHPNDAGFSHYGENLCKEIARIIK